MKQKIRTASILLLMVLGTVLVLMACGSKSLADSRTAGSDSYGLNVESMTGTDSLGYTPVVSDMKKIVQKTAALSFPQWALAVWDMDTATLYMVKYDRSH